MTEQLETIKPEKQPVEAKYRYLEDLNRQDSPNLRKLYRNSFEGSEKRSASSQRPSPFSSHKRNAFINRYSPSCSTFNPKREITQEQFSPYDDRPDKEEERLNQQLREENIQLKTQLIQANQTIQSLNIQLSRREGELIKVKEASQADLHYFQKVVSEMTGEIQLVLTKNKILENQLIVVKTRLQQELRRQQDMVRLEEQRRKFQQKMDQHLREQRKPVGVLTSQPQSRRSVGKLLNRPTAIQEKSSLGTSKIKIEEDSENLSNQNYCDTKGVLDKKNQNIQKLEKESKKGEQLIESIKSMHVKITGIQASTLRQLWKWLKGLGHSHSCLKRWKSRAQANSYLNSDRLRELLKEGCSYIQ